MSPYVCEQLDDFVRSEHWTFEHGALSTATSRQPSTSQGTVTGGVRNPDSRFQDALHVSPEYVTHNIDGT